MAASKSYDLTIIGSGPGGYVAAVRAAQLGMSVLLVEKDADLGGVCTLRGCIPTKALLHTADLLTETKRGSEVGVRTSGVQLDWPAAMAYKSRVVRQSSNGVTFLMKKNKVQVAAGFGSIVDPTHVRVAHADGTESVFSTRFILIATGSAPRPLPSVPFDGKRILSSDHVLELLEVPASMIVLGAGAVGVEFASMYARFGTEVTLLEALPRIVPLEDEEVSAELARAFRRQGVSVKAGATVEAVEMTPDGVRARVQLADGSSESREAAKLLVAIGRRPLTSGIGLEAVGVETQRGFIQVDPYLRTNVPNIYAIGDVVPTPALAHVAMMEGVIAVETMAGHETEPLNHEQTPNATYSDPEVASIGLTEAKARERGADVRVGRFPFSASGKARILGQAAGFVKIVAEPKRGIVLGVHMIGPRVTETLSEVATAMRLEITAIDLVRTVHAHPTLAEAVHEAAEAVLGAPIHV